MYNCRKEKIQICAQKNKVTDSCAIQFDENDYVLAFVLSTKHLPCQSLIAGDRQSPLVLLVFHINKQSRRIRTSHCYTNKDWCKSPSSGCHCKVGQGCRHPKSTRPRAWPASQSNYPRRKKISFVLTLATSACFGTRPQFARCQDSRSRPRVSTWPHHL